MPFSVDVKIENMAEIQRAIKQHPERARKVFSKALYDSAGTLANAIKGSQLTPVDTGNMINKTGFRRLGDWSSMTFVATTYAAVVHQGIDSDIQLPKAINIFLPGVGWRRITKIKARPARPFVDWALRDGAQAKIDAIMSKALALVTSPNPV